MPSIKYFYFEATNNKGRWNRFFHHHFYLPVPILQISIYIFDLVILGVIGINIILIFLLEDVSDCTIITKYSSHLILFPIAWYSLDSDVNDPFKGPYYPDYFATY